MATAAILPDHRVATALSVASHPEVIPVDDHPGYFYVTDTSTNLGQTYIATSLECHCPDYIAHGRSCQHIAAVKREALALLAYAADWDRRAVAQQLACPMYDAGRGAGRRGRRYGQRGIDRRGSTRAGWRSRRRWYATHEPLNASPWDYPRGER